MWILCVFSYEVTHFTTSLFFILHFSPQESITPHLFVIAERAYNSMMMSTKAKDRDQSIIISGESGAGETISTYLICSWLSSLTLPPLVRQD